MTTPPARILIVDDEPLERSFLENELGAAGYSAVTAANLSEADRKLAGSKFEVLVTSLLIAGQDNLRFLRDVKKQNPTLAMIVLTDYRTIETAVEAMKLGAFDYLRKPFSKEELLLKIEKLLRYEQVVSENEELRQQIVLRHLENPTVAAAETDQPVDAEAPESAMPGKPGDLLSLKLSEIEHIDIGTVLEDLETRLIHWALEKAEGNLTKAAELLGIPLSTLQYKINKRSPSLSPLSDSC